jgi:hypothetical protein
MRSQDVFSSRRYHPGLVLALGFACLTSVLSSAAVPPGFRTSATLNTVFTAVGGGALDSLACRGYRQAGHPRCTGGVRDPRTVCGGAILSYGRSRNLDAGTYRPPVGNCEPAAPDCSRPSSQGWQQTRCQSWPAGPIQSDSRRGLHVEPPCLLGRNSARLEGVTRPRPTLCVPPRNGLVSRATAAGRPGRVRYSPVWRGPAAAVERRTQPQLRCSLSTGR